MTDGERAVVVVAPGDTLVLIVPHSISAAEADALRSQVASRLPGVNLAIAAGVTQALVYRPADESPVQPTDTHHV